MVQVAGVALGGEYLAVVSGAILFDHTAVEGVVVAHLVRLYQFLVGGVVVYLAMDNGIESEAFAETGLLGRVTHSQGNDRHHPLGALQELGNRTCIVVDGAEIAESEPNVSDQDAVR